MRIREIIVESYSLALSEFSQVADPAIVQTTINQYKQLVNKNQFRNPEEKNINHWRRLGWEAFSQMVKLKSSDITDSQMKKGKVSGNAVILHDDAEWVVLIPLDKESSVHYGKYTEWCTTKIFWSFYEDYVYEQGITLIYAIDKTKSGRSVAISINPNGKNGETIEMFNQQDKIINATQYTKISGFDSEKFIKLAKLPTNQQRLTDAIDRYTKSMFVTHKLLATSPLDHDAIERELKFNKNDEHSYNYIIAYGREQNRQVEVHSSILVSAASYFDKSDNYHDEALIIGKYINFSNIPIGLTKTILRSAPALLVFNHQSLTEEQRSLIPTYGKASFLYSGIIDKRFYEGEAAIAQDAESAYMYAWRFFSSSGWPAGEAAIATSSWYSCMYVKHVTNKPFPAGEAAIAQDAEDAYTYAEMLFAKVGWPDGEAAIAKEAEYSCKYATNVLNKPFPAGEAVIVKDKDWTLEYVSNVLKYHRSPSWENLIKNDPEKSLSYAKERNEPFPAGELAILNDLNCTEAYVQDVLVKHKSPTWEQLIKDNTNASYSYAVLLKKPFPAGEAAIASDPTLATKYDELFGTNLSQR